MPFSSINRPAVQPYEPARRNAQLLALLIDTMARRAQALKGAVPEQFKVAAVGLDMVTH